MITFSVKNDKRYKSRMFMRRTLFFLRPSIVRLSCSMNKQRNYDKPRSTLGWPYSIKKLICDQKYVEWIVAGYPCDSYSEWLQQKGKELIRSEKNKNKTDYLTTRPRGTFQ